MKMLLLLLLMVMMGRGDPELGQSHFFEEHCLLFEGFAVDGTLIAGDNIVGSE